MSKINILPPQLADMIAAGEVVERPASVIKELVENSIDAGAKNITIEIKAGGIPFIRVSDDGSGMGADDAGLCFSRHATSKLHTSRDLEAISTMGFRGEALAAISSISRIELISRREEDEYGTKVCLEAGEIISVSPCGASVGTSICVCDLFYNTPARLKFLKSDRAESSACNLCTLRSALSRPDISFKFIRDGKEEFFSTGDGKISSAIYNLLGRETQKELIPLHFVGVGVSVEGMVSSPRFGHGNRGKQFFFCNSRPIKSLQVQTALERAYKNNLLGGRFPSAYINIKMSEAAVDVNVHPSKLEVKFRDEKAVFDAVYFGTIDAIEREEGEKEIIPLLNKKQIAGTSDFTIETGVQSSLNLDEIFAKKPIEEKPMYSFKAKERELLPWVPQEEAEEDEKKEEIKPELKLQELGLSEEKIDIEEELEKLLIKDKEKEPEEKKDENQGRFGHDPDFMKKVNEEIEKRERINEENRLRYISLLNNDEDLDPRNPEHLAIAMERRKARKEEEERRFIFRLDSKKHPLPYDPEEMSGKVVYKETPKIRLIGETMKTYIIVEYDGELIMIDKHAAHERMLFNNLKEKGHKAMSQSLLAPETIKVSMETVEIFEKNQELMENYGFEIDVFGDDSLIIRSVPESITKSEIVPVVEELLDKLVLGNLSEDELQDDVLHSIACKAAVRANDITQDEELLLIAEAAILGKAKYCPHGRPTTIKFSKNQLDKEFSRIL